MIHHEILMITLLNSQHKAKAQGSYQIDYYGGDIQYRNEKKG